MTIKKFLSTHRQNQFILNSLNLQNLLQINFLVIIIHIIIQPFFSLYQIFSLHFYYFLQPIDIFHKDA